MARKTKRAPKRKTVLGYPLTLHKATGQAYLRLDGLRYYMGRWEAPATEEKARRFVQEWVARGCQPPPPAADELLVVELCARFLGHAEGYYRRPDGTQTSEVANLNRVLKALTTLYETLPVRDFGPACLKAVRAAWVTGAIPGMKGPASRGVVNKDVRRIRSIVRWGVAEGLVEPNVLVALKAVDPLKRGRCDARE